MTLTQHPPRRTAAVTTALLLLALGGCGDTRHDDARLPAADSEPAAYADPATVCAGFARDRFAHDTTDDAGPDAAHQRAQAWLHPDLLHHPPPPGRHPQWRTWRGRQAVIEVRVEEWAGDALPPDTDQTAYRAVLVTTTPVGVGGWTGSTGRHTLYCALHPVDNVWLIADYHVDTVVEMS
jgi:hypothetical protein